MIETALSLDFPPELAQSQIETLINWGRYAELLAYDDDDEMIFFKTETSRIKSTR